MIIWFFQRRGQLDPTMDTLVPLGLHLPTFSEFQEKVAEAKITLPKGFEESYFDPCISALKRMGETVEGFGTWPYCGFKIEGEVMCAIQGWAITPG